MPSLVMWRQPLVCTVVQSAVSTLLFIAMRGFMTSSGVPDCPRSARILLKDYVNVSNLHYIFPVPLYILFLELEPRLLVI